MEKWPPALRLLLHDAIGRVSEELHIRLKNGSAGSDRRVTEVLSTGAPKEITDSVGGKTVTISWENGKSTFLVDGERTEPFHTFWFAWVAQYPHTEIYGQEE